MEIRSITVSGEMLERLIEEIEGCDYCCLCDQYPGKEHRGHRHDCPLLNKEDEEIEIIQPWEDGIGNML